MVHFTTVKDFNDAPVRVIVNPGENRTTVSIPINNDDLLEPIEFFNVAFSIGGTNTDSAVLRRPRIIQVAIASEDGTLHCY